jgi:hypothetical protein
MSEKRLAQYGIKYRQPLEAFLDMFLPADEIKPVSITSILVLTDKRPRSLFVIAYSLRLAQAFNAYLYAFTQGLHDALIQDEAQSYGINLALMKSYRNPLSTTSILELVQQHDIDMIVTHGLYDTVERLLDRSPVPVLIVKVQRFIRKSDD